jgi:hypothetical protein
MKEIRRKSKWPMADTNNQMGARALAGLVTILANVHALE